MGSLLNRAVNRHSFGTSLTAASICQAAEKLATGRWQTISFQDGILKVRVGDYDTLASLRTNEATTLHAINNEVGADVVKQIKYTVSPLRSDEDLVA